MIDLKSNIIYNIPYIFCVPRSKATYLSGIEYTFKNVCIFDEDMEFTQLFKDFCLKNKIKKVILTNYEANYTSLISSLKSINVDVSCYYLDPLGSLSNEYSREVFNGVMNLYDNDLITSVAFLDINMFESFRDKIKCYYLPLDFPKPSPTPHSRETRQGIGLLSDSSNFTHSYYNALSAVKAVGEQANLIPTSIVKSFITTFDIKTKYFSSEQQILESSKINLFINFSESNYFNFFQSMDLGIVCLLGNQQIISRNDPLYKFIVIDSDDDIMEIAKKTKEGLKHQKKIFKAYRDFRKKYSEVVDKKRRQFLPDFYHHTPEPSEKLLSVIIPIYNTEKYLEKAIKSVVDASISNMEIILINDGSTDSSGRIAKLFAKKYPELIRYIEQPNQGLGNVRNIGLREAKGKYITSVDSDDFISPNLYQDSEKYLLEDVDIVIYDWESISKNGAFQTSARDGVIDKFSGIESLLFSSIMPSACNKIIKKAIFSNNSLKFAEKKYEDLSTIPIILLKAESIAYIPKPYYKYNISDSSIMRSKISLDMVDVLALLDQRLKIHCQDSPTLHNFYFYVFLWRIEQFIIEPLYNVSQKELEKRVRYIYKKLNPILRTVYNSPMVKDFFNTIQDKNIKKFFSNRNKAILSGQLTDFILHHHDKFFTIQPADVYFGKS